MHAIRGSRIRGIGTDVLEAGGSARSDFLSEYGYIRRQPLCTISLSFMSVQAYRFRVADDITVTIVVGHPEFFSRRKARGFVLPKSKPVFVIKRHCNIVRCSVICFMPVIHSAIVSKPQRLTRVQIILL